MEHEATSIAAFVNATILIPTFNRPRHLRRLLRFLAGAGNPYPVLILDGSSPSNAAINARLAAEHESVQVRKYPSELHLGLRYADGLQHVETRYVVICGDDDFVFPASVHQCAEFLDNHQDYSAAIGRVKALSYSARWPILRRGFTLNDPLSLDFNLTHKWSVQRILHLMACTTAGCPPLFYALRRTDQAMQAFSLVNAQLKYSSQEHLTNAVTLLFGKAVVLPTIFGLRDYASAPIREPQRDDPDTYFTTADLSYLKRVLVPIMMKREAFSREMAEFLASLFLEHWRPQDKAPSASIGPSVRSWATRIGFAASALQSIFLPALFASRFNLDDEVVRALAKAQREFVDDETA